MKLNDINTKPVFIPSKANFQKRGDTYSGVYKNIWINKLTLDDIAVLQQHADEELEVETRVWTNGNKYNVLTILAKEEEE
jgi:hypothetical protein